MPIYDFECAACGPFAVMRRMADRDTPCHCPDCGGEGTRVMTAPSLALMGGASRAAHATNERAAHAPRHSGDGPSSRHRPGCSCCAGGKVSLAGASGQTSTATGGLKRPTGRPWMISH
ncbi:MULTISPECIES: FmdB family zinc ribbon protein [Pandoraea]|uniref:FmdB family regulatory protein n=1 Tax=Pandoraea cepalis TaxID=2508294 RepID=A0A5E4RMW4_9BURK|nr:MULTISPECIES: zinc ribbon domain-containing protein [Pandoraea]QBC30169.1 zinc ribbon domain-containing protein [Pandoraea sp. XY-2]VVD63379.1 FmdB family regulatory protein [Pandoraea cepalis]